jgi:steroid 5-alpha reductase family enzyme
MPADPIVGLHQGHAMALGQQPCRGEARNTAAHHSDIQRTIVGTCYRHMPLQPPRTPQLRSESGFGFGGSHPNAILLRILHVTCVSLLLTIAILLSAVMALAWAIARRPGQSGWTDAIWSFAIGAAGVTGALAPIAGPPTARQILVAVLVALWALRLGIHIAIRSAASGDDPRYAELKRQWGARFSSRLFLFLQVQAAAALLLVISIMAAARNPAPGLGWSDWLGAIVLGVAIVGEGFADRQLTRFRHDPVNKGRVCDAGLWGWSRHPNYFFEWLGWTAYALIAIGPAGQYGWGWIALSGPLFMYWLLVHVSGIPPLEAHMERSRGATFHAYRARVSAFWPMPPRSSEEAYP